MSENWKIQVSPKVGDTLINLRAETPDEAERILAWATANAGTIAATVAAFGGATKVGQSFPGAQVVQQDGPSWSQQGTQQQAAAAPQGDGQRCVHGPMTYREGTGKASGKPYKAYFCSAPKGSSCDPVFVR